MDASLAQRALVVLRGCEWLTRNMAENPYCPSCATNDDRWRDQVEHHPGCEWQAVVAALAEVK